MERRSILPPEMRGVAHFTGARGIGKSFLMSQLDFPDNLLFMDYENKGESLDNQIKFGAYHAITRGENLSPLEVYEKTQRIITEIPSNRFTVAAIDNVSWLELALRAEANRNLERYVVDYNLNIKNVKANRFGGLSSVVNFLISDRICNPLHSKGIRLVAITSHVKPQWGISGPIPNKKRIKGADRWQELSILSIVLVPGRYPPIPAGLVMKEQLGQIAIPDPMKLSDTDYELYQRGELGHSVRRRLPMKLPRATAQAIRYYLAHPADIENPPEDEIPGPEQDEYSDKLTNEQIAFMTAEAEFAKREEEQKEKEYRAVIEMEKLEKMANVMEVARPLYNNGITKMTDLKQALEKEGISVLPPILAKIISVLSSEKEDTEEEYDDE